MRADVMRWKKMADADLGYMVKPVAEAMYKLATKVLEEKEHQFDADDMKEILPLLRGFAINYHLEDEVSVIETLDLCIINITKEAYEDFDYFMMTVKGWEMRYDYCRNTEA